jgi:RNA polymerase sigma-70 factor, ECF subfamily
LKADTQKETLLTREEEIIKKSLQDPRAFQPLYEKYFRSIYVFVFHRIGDKSIAADVTSQVFLKALVKLKQFQFRGFPFSSWLFRIAVNECNDHFRKTRRARLVILEENHAEILYEEMFGQDTMEELRTRLPEILEKLSEEELMCIELRFMEARPFKEVSEILGITETYAKVKTYRILDKMKKLFIENEK